MSLMDHLEAAGSQVLCQGVCEPRLGYCSGGICSQLGIILGAWHMHRRSSCCMPWRGLAMHRLLHPDMSAVLPFKLRC